MGLLRFDCDRHSHDSILVEVPDSMRRAYGEEIEVACPVCNTEMEYTIVDRKR